MIIASDKSEFEEFAEEGETFLRQLEHHLGSPDRAYAISVMRVTFRVLRDHLSVEDSLLLLSHLPMAIKSIYGDGWQIRNPEKIKNIDDFIVAVMRRDENPATEDYISEGDILESVYATVKTLKSYIKKGTMDQALSGLPKNVRSIFKPAGRIHTNTI